MIGMLKVSFLLLAVVLFYGCNPIGFMEDRAFADKMKDSSIERGIRYHLYKMDPQAEADISVSVQGNLALLTGYVTKSEWKEKAAQCAYKEKDIHKVENHIIVKNAGTFWDGAGDSSITNQAKASLLLDGDIKSINYHIVTFNKCIYLMGVARGKGEMDKVLQKLRSVGNVKKVYSFVELLP